MEPMIRLENITKHYGSTVAVNNLTMEVADGDVCILIGPSGFGGRTTVLGVKIGKRHRVPACFFVSVSYVCWAYRKAFMTIQGGKVAYDWD